MRTPPSLGSVTRTTMLAIFLLTGISSSLSQAQPALLESEILPTFYYFDEQLLLNLNQREKSNWIISPLSVRTLLSILLEGASGPTALELCKVLRLPPQVTLARTIARRQQIAQAPSDDAVTKSGSFILVKEGLGVNNQFRTNALDYYSTPLKVSNFSNPILLSQEVNKWIQQLTNSYIPELLSPDVISRDSALLLANAVYFKGDWQIEFNRSATHTECFYTPQCEMVTMMETSGSYKTGEIRELKSKVLELPYKDPRYSMIIVMPHESIGLQGTVWALSISSVLNYLDLLVGIELDLVMPKFSIEYSTELKPILQNSGVSDIFSDNADFSELFHSGTSAKVSGISHRAKIELGEKGTIAAGASVAQFQLLSTNKKARVIINRPFFFFVRDIKSGILFEGQIADLKSV